MQRRKTTCLPPTKSYYLLLLSWSFRTSDQQLDLLLEANIEHNTCKADKQDQLRQYTNQEKALKKEQGLAQGSRTQKHSGLQGDLDHITQGYVLGIF
jgi:hypothetical protein